MTAFCVVTSSPVVGCHDGHERHGQEPVHLARHAVVDRLRLLCRLFLLGVVLDEQPRHGGTERGLPGLQRHLHLRARLGVLAGIRQLEDAR